MLTFLAKKSGIAQSIQNAKEQRRHNETSCTLVTITICSYIISQVQLNSAHNLDPILTFLSYLLVFFHRWTHIVVTPVDIHSLSVIQFQQVFCAQCHSLRVVKTLHPIQPHEMYIVGSIDCACNSIYCVCCRNTSTKNRVVLYVVNSTIQNYTQFQ